MSNYAIVNNVFRHDIKEQYNNKFTDNHLLLLVYMQKYKTYSGEMSFTLSWLFDDLKINYKLQQEMINCLSDIVEWNLIYSLYNADKINKNTRLQCKISEYDNRFTKVLLKDFDSIFALDVDIRTKKTMLFLYVDIASWIDTKGYCYTSYHYFKQDLKTTSDNRINDSLVLLRENYIIDYDNVGQILIDGKIEQGNNVYVLCNEVNYKETLQRGLSNRKRDYEEKKAVIHKGETSNKSRMLKQKKNYLDKKYYSNSITYKELKELEKIEKEYYKLNKLNKERLTGVEFITLHIDK